MHKRVFVWIGLTLILACPAIDALEFTKPLKSRVVITKPASIHAFTPNTLIETQEPPHKLVTVMGVHLTENEKIQLQQMLSVYDANKSSQPASGLPADQTLAPQANINLNYIPVLDQGDHGSCATFAVTTALDALLKKGDYISQFCHLELGSYLAAKGYQLSGWEGSNGDMVMNQILSFGIINKNNQRAHACGSLTEYPLSNPYYIGSPLSLEEFSKHSENIGKNISWNPMLTLEQRFSWNPHSNAQADALLNEIKKTLIEKKPYQESVMTLAVLLPVTFCSAGACAQHRKLDDTWVITRPIQDLAFRPDYPEEIQDSLATHMMVIVGYNDTATAVDYLGGKHQGLLALRNSWGDDTGDDGNFYMSYDFFKEYILEVQKITLHTRF